MVERTFKSGESVEAADIHEQPMQYLYTDDSFWYFMVPDTFEQHAADANAVADITQWLKDGDTCLVTLWNGSPLQVAPPNFVELAIVETDPGLRGDTAQGGVKPAKLETGAVVPGTAVRGAGRSHQGGHAQRRIRVPSQVVIRNRNHMVADRDIGVRTYRNAPFMLNICQLKPADRGEDCHEQRAVEPPIAYGRGSSEAGTR